MKEFVKDGKVFRLSMTAEEAQEFYMWKLQKKFKAMDKAKLLDEFAHEVIKSDNEEKVSLIVEELYSRMSY